MKVAVTGGSGSVGLAVMAQLLAEGHEATDISAAPPPGWARPLLPGVGHVTLDVTDAAGLRDALADLRPDAVLHLAALTPDEAAERADPQRIMAVNTGGTAALLGAVAAVCPTARCLLLSSVAAYGHSAADVAVVDEATTSLAPTGLYGISKQAAEAVGLRLAGLHGLDLRIARLAAVWGPFEHRTSARAVPSVPFQIAGAVLRGEPVRLPRLPSQALVESGEAARALVALALIEAPTHRLVNIGTGATETPEAMLGWLAAQAGLDWAVDEAAPTVTVFADRRPPQAVGRLRETLGWVPRTTLASGIADYLGWARGLSAPLAPFD